MNTQELGKIRKQFKVDSDLRIREICSYYIKEENKQVIGSEKEYFDQMGEEKRELFLKNFKKILTGRLSGKIFEVDFKNNKLGGNPTQKTLYQAVNNADFGQNTSDILATILEKHTYGTDYVVSFMRGELFVPTAPKTKDIEKINESSDYYQFIMGVISPIKLPKKALKFDFDNKEFKAEIPMDAIINTTSPLDGFMFPSFSNGFADANKVLYYTKSENCPNLIFVEEILGCEITATAGDDREKFLDILKVVAGEQIKPEFVANVYHTIEKLITENEVTDDDIPSLDIKDMEWILKNSGVEDTVRLEPAFLKIVDKDYKFKATNLLPTSRTVDLRNDTAKIQLTPEDLKRVKQVVKDGRRYLMIQIDDSAILEGFELENEEI